MPPGPGRSSAADAPDMWLPNTVGGLWLAAALIGFCVALLSTVLDWTLLRLPLERAGISDAVFGIIVGALVFRLMMHGQRRREQVMQRLETIEEMNHHIRNALQVISFNARPASRNEWELAEIDQAVNRIQWALREIVPKLEPHFAPFEGSARLHREQVPPAAEPPVNPQNPV